MSDLLALPGATFSDQQHRLIEAAAGAPAERAQDLLLLLAADFWRRDLRAQFAECFRRAYRIRPFWDVSRVAANPASMDELSDLAQTLLDHGVRYAPVIAQLAVAQGRLGDSGAVRRLVDYDRFFHHGVCEPPAGTSSPAFHRQLADEIKARQTYYDQPAGRSIRKGWRHNKVLERQSPAIRALRAILKAQIERYLDALPGDATHPYLVSRPSETAINGWAVMSGPETHHEPHIHSFAWATGVYYVSQPPASLRGDRRGWLCVGPPPVGKQPDRARLAASWDTRMIEPAPGALVLMPAYFYHQTEPMSVDEERICVAFEVGFPELSNASDA